MKLKICLLAALLLCSFSLWAEMYKRGNRACDFEKTEAYYNDDPEDLYNQTHYAFCLILKGEDSEGLPRLYILADHHNHVTASYHLADYLNFGGTFSTESVISNIDKALKYYFHTLATIAYLADYPEPDYFFDEKDYQMELWSRGKIVGLYKHKYQFGAIGDYRKHLYQSPSYEGDIQETFPQYNTHMKDSLERLLQYSTECANLPQKRHFYSDPYKAIIEACKGDKDLALQLMPLEVKRTGILLQPNCKDLNETNCPEYYETHTDIHNLIEDSWEKVMDIIAKIPPR